MDRQTCNMLAMIRLHLPLAAGQGVNRGSAWGTLSTDLFENHSFLVPKIVDLCSSPDSTWPEQERVVRRRFPFP